MTLDGTRTYIVGRGQPVVIDPGPESMPHVDAILEALAGVVPSAIVLTHAHRDHAGSANLLAERTGAPVLMAKGARRLPRMLRTGGWVHNGDVLKTDAGTLRVLATPGHSPEHIALIWEQCGPRSRRAAFVGDLLLGEGDTTLIAGSEGDLGDYFRSLRRIEEERPAVVYPGHGPPITVPSETIARYRAHRSARLVALRDALAKNPDLDNDALVDQIYGSGLDPSLRRAAAGSIAAMVRYMRESD